MYFRTPVHIHRNSEHTILIARAGAALDIAHVIRSSESFQAGTFVEQIIQLIRIEMTFAAQL